MTPAELDYAVWPLFYQMQKRGIQVSVSSMEELRANMVAQRDEQAALIEAYAERALDPAKSAEVGAWLESVYSVGKRTKKTKARATDERSLKQYPQHPVIDGVLEWRGLNKAVTTFIDPVLELARLDPSPDALTGVIHPKWKLTRVRSGRVACEDPNLLAFPVRDDLGKKVRSCFVARPGYYMCSVDFSQLEPRIVAALSGDDKLLRIYKDGRDLYQEIATDLGVSRTVAKILTLGILYGMGGQRLFEQLMLAGCVDSTGLPVYDLVQCELLIEQWFCAYPAVKKLVGDTVAAARRDGGWAYTVGRRGRFLPGLFLTSDGWPAGKLREEAERQAFNHLIQGTGMEELKMAMLRVATKAPPSIHMLLAIHDEIVFEVPDSTAGVHAKQLAETMSSNIRGVELRTTWTVGPDWGSLKG